jgi:hypothetical protein
MCIKNQSHFYGFGSSLSFFFFLRQRVLLCSPSGLKLTIPLSQPLECWNYRCLSPHPAMISFLSL